jgi:mono/diheme cytochrome c family protein
MIEGYKIRPLCLFSALFLLLILQSACNRDRRHPGWDYFPDMFYSTAYESYSENPNFSDGMTMRVPPAGTVPVGYTPFEYANDPESRTKAGDELKNPFSPTDENLLKGKSVFATFCMVCHGEKGDGNGNLYTSGLYPLKPQDLISAQILKLRDGELYHTITLGIRSMGSYGSQIYPDDRWKVVLYIRELQRYQSNNQAK